MVRNPLYLGNLAGVVGFAFAVEQPMLALLLGLVFAPCYPSVVAKEEAQLARIFGERYVAYCAAVPRWIPDWSRYQEPATAASRAARSWMRVVPVGVRALGIHRGAAQPQAAADAALMSSHISNVRPKPDKVLTSSRITRPSS